MRILFFGLLLLGLTLAVGDAPVVADGPAAAAGTGSVEGTIIYRRDPKRFWRYQRFYVKDRKQGYLAEAVVALSSGTLDGGKLSAAPKPEKPAVHSVDQKNYRFIPETTAVRAGDQVRFSNSDGVLHNVFTRNPLLPFDINLREGDARLLTFPKAGGAERPARLRCVFHSTMQAWVFVFDHPYFQVTGEDGRFALKNVPPGKYRLDVVHPAGELATHQEIEVRSGETTQLKIELSPDDLVTDEG